MPAICIYLCLQGKFYFSFLLLVSLVIRLKHQTRYVSVFKDKLSIFVGLSRRDLHGLRYNIFGGV